MPEDHEYGSLERPAATSEPTVYVVRHYAPDRADGDHLAEVVAALKHGRRYILIAALLGSALGLAYALLAPPWYRAEVLLMPVSDQSAQGLLAQFGGLASLAGIDIGGAEKVEPLAVLNSRDLVRQFIEREKLTTVLLARKWDARTGRWKGDEEDWPDIRDAIKYFNKKVRRVTEERRTGLVTLAIEWKDPVAAAEWANGLAKLLNQKMRARAIDESTKNIAYLRSELAGTNVLAVHESIGRLLQYEFQKLMLAKGSEDFAFRVIDKADVPKKKFKPRRMVIVLGSGLMSALMTSVFVIFSRLQRRRAPRGLP
jgi:uncharacterized protein involved in exopolysaccharide biosynthesis